MTFLMTFCMIKSQRKTILINDFKLSSSFAGGTLMWLVKKSKDNIFLLHVCQDFKK